MASMTCIACIACVRLTWGSGMGEWDGVGICGAGHLSKGAWRTCERAVVSVEVKLRYML